jgi:hypothetical protein
MYDKANNLSEKEKAQLNQKLETLYGSLLEKLPDQDLYLLALPLHDLKRKGIGYKKEWIYQGIAAITTRKTRLVTRRSEQNQHTQRVRNRERRKQRRNMLEGMRTIICMTGLEDQDINPPLIRNPRKIKHIDKAVHKGTDK